MRRRKKEGRQQMPVFQKPDATAVSTDDASAVSAPTLLNDQPRTLRFLDIEAGCGAACFESLVGQGDAAEHLSSSDCCI